MSIPGKPATESPVRIVSVPRCRDWPWHPYAECPRCGAVICYGHAAYREEWLDSHGVKWCANLRHADCAAPMYGEEEWYVDPLDICSGCEPIGDDCAVCANTNG